MLRAAGLVLPTLFLATATQPVLASELSPAEARGQRIYLTGESTSSRLIKASVRFGAPPVPAATVPCVSCHGADGTGSDDDSASAPVPDINWSVLMAPDGHVHTKRRHKVFDEASFFAAITAGRDPDGNQLDFAMPRYEMAEADLLDLIAYLKSIDKVPDPGLGDDRLRVGTVLPLAGPLAGEGHAMRLLIEAYFDSVNAGGGIHGRELELVVAGYGENDDPAIWKARDLVASGTVFALLATYLPGFDAELAELAEDEEIPLIGPNTVMPVADAETGHSFYVLSGLPQQAEALVDAIAAGDDDVDNGIAIISPRLLGFDRVAAGAVERAERKGVTVALELEYPLGRFDADGVLARLKASGAGAVVFLGAARDFMDLAAAADESDWHPQLLAPGPLVEAALSGLPEGFSERVRLAYAWTPGDEKLAALKSRYQDRLPARANYAGFGTPEAAAFAATTVLLEGLDGAGRDLSREALVASLEKLDAFHPGLTPAVSYSSDRRLGSNGAWNVIIALAGRPAVVSAEWIEQHVPYTERAMPHFLDGMHKAGL